MRDPISMTSTGRSVRLMSACQRELMDCKYGFPALPGALAVGGLSTRVIGVFKPVRNDIARPPARLYGYSLLILIMNRDPLRESRGWLHAIPTQFSELIRFIEKNVTSTERK